MVALYVASNCAKNMYRVLLKCGIRHPLSLNSFGFVVQSFMGELWYGKKICFVFSNRFITPINSAPVIFSSTLCRERPLCPLAASFPSHLELCQRVNDFTTKRKEISTLSSTPPPRPLKCGQKLSASNRAKKNMEMAEHS